LCIIIETFFLRGKASISSAVDTKLTNRYIESQKEMFEDTTGVIRICKSKTGRRCNGQKKRDNRTNNDLRNTTQKTID